MLSAFDAFFFFKRPKPYYTAGTTTVRRVRPSSHGNNRYAHAAITMRHTYGEARPTKRVSGPSRIVRPRRGERDGPRPTSNARVRRRAKDGPRRLRPTRFVAVHARFGRSGRRGRRIRSGRRFNNEGRRFSASPVVIERALRLSLARVSADHFAGTESRSTTSTQILKVRFKSAKT